MPVELEAKMRVTDHEAIRRKLAEHGLEPVSRVLEMNSFFDTEDRRLLAGDEGLRVRHERDLSGAEGASRVTFKGPRQAGPLKSRQELEVGIDDPDTMEQILRRLGFVRVLRFEKRRDQYRLDGCDVTLDELPHLGSFVEIEGPDEATVMAVREKLDLGDRPLLTSSYVSMLAAHLQERDRGGSDIRFEEAAE